MKIGLIISAVIVLLVLVIGCFIYWGNPDRPSGAIRDDMLQRIEFEASLPEFFAAAGSGDAADHYRTAVEIVTSNRLAGKRGAPDARQLDRVIAELIRGMGQSSVTHGFIDDQVPMTPAAIPEYDEALVWMARQISKSAQEVGGARGMEQARALMAFGLRLYQHNDRLRPRFEGLVVMKMAIEAMYALVQNDSAVTSDQLDDIQPWIQAFQRIEPVVHDKRQSVHTPDPHVGDLMLLAERDEDRTYRIEATLSLGFAKFTSPSRGNQRVIRQYLKRAMDGDDPLLAAAAEVARDYTKLQMHTMRMR